MSQKIDRSIYSQHPSPGELHKAFQAATPMQQQTIMAQFIGSHICWDTQLFSVNAAYPQHPERVHLSVTTKLDASTHMGLQVSADIIAADYPELLDAQRGRHIIIYGRLREIEEFAVQVDLDALEVKPHHFWDSTTQFSGGGRL